MHGAVYVLYVTTTLIIAVVCMAVSLTNSKRCIEVWSDVWSMLHDHKQSAEALLTTSINARNCCTALFVLWVVFTALLYVT